jgi:hypothetical protein
MDVAAMIAADLAENAVARRAHDAYVARHGVPGRCYCRDEVSILGHDRGKGQCVYRTIQSTVRTEQRLALRRQAWL